MRISTLSFACLLPVALLAAAVNDDDDSSNPITATNLPNHPAATLTSSFQQSMSPSSFSSPSPSPSSQPQPHQQPTPEIHYNTLELRQGVGAAGGQVGILPSATQMSPTTIYEIRGPNGAKTPVAFTQLFSKIPEQWPAPTAGTIGLGTIQGVVGVVRTRKRSVAMPTAMAELVALVKRQVADVGLAAKKMQGEDAASEGNAGVVVNGADVMRVSGLGVAAAVLVIGLVGL